MKRILCPGVLCLLLSTAAPLRAGAVVWDFGAAAGVDRNKTLPGPRSPSSPSRATAAEYHQDLAGATLNVYAYSSRISALPKASFVGILAVPRDHRWNSTSQSLE
jgi:hypothetical protein